MPALDPASSFPAVSAAESFVAIVGPPGVGKSTVTGALADRFGAHVFRLREFVQEFRLRSAVDERLFTSRDALGWLAEDAVFLLLRTAFLQGQFPGRGLVLLENFPGSLTQFLLLKALTEHLGAPFSVVELTTTDNVLTNRVRARRVCPNCETDPHGDPHRPAHPSTHEPGRCARCDGGLVHRRGDEPQRFAARLARFRRRIPAIRKAAATLSLPYHAVDATCDSRACLHRVITILTVHEPSNCLPASRHKR